MSVLLVVQSVVADDEQMQTPVNDLKQNCHLCNIRKGGQEWIPGKTKLNGRIETVSKEIS